MKESFCLRKLRHQKPPELEYFLGEVNLNALIGKPLTITFEGEIVCLHCERKIKKSFNQGYCYPCFRDLARCDICIVRPHLCHYKEGTCREPQWGQRHCLIDHVVYLANTTGLKVGVTGAHKVHERWGDQGAVAAMVIAKVPERLFAGELEMVLSQHISDKSNWRHLVTGKMTDVDLASEHKNLLTVIPETFQRYIVPTPEIVTFKYPVEHYPDAARTWNLEKTPVVTGQLTGIRGQYIFVGGKALNIRKFQGYKVTLGI